MNIETKRLISVVISDIIIGIIFIISIYTIMLINPNFNAENYNDWRAYIIDILEIGYLISLHYILYNPIDNFIKLKIFKL